MSKFTNSKAQPPYLVEDMDGFQLFTQKVADKTGEKTPAFFSGLR
jgi:hypothetical protein